MAEIKKYLDTTALGTLVDQIKAEDAKVKAYADAQIEAAGKTYDAAGAAATAESNAKTYTDQLANGAVKANTDAIAKLNGGETEEGSVAKAVADSAAVLQANINAVDEIADANAADIVTMKGQIDALEKGTYDDTEVRELISANGDAIKALEQTHTTDKGTLEGAIALKADQSALDDVSAVANAAVKQSDYDTKVAALEAEDARIAGLVADETSAREAADIEINERLTEVEAFFELAEGEQLDTALDTLKEIQTYITTEGAAADQMVLDIAANAKAIENEVEARGEADAALQEAIDLKADASVVETLSGKVTDLETASETHALKTEVEAVSDALNEYKTAHTSDYTNAQIDAAIKAVADDVAELGDTYATDEELAQAIEDEVARANAAYAAKSLDATVSELSATVDTKAAQSDVANLQSDMTQAKTDIDAVEALAAANEAAIKVNADAIALKAAQSDLEAAVARIAANETAIAANTSAINSFSAITSDEVNAMFA